MLRLSRLFILVLAVLVACAGTAQAAFPERPITMIVPFGAGGSNDLPARVLAGMMEKKLGQPVIVQNVVGAGGTQGTTQIAQARPDGYTIGFDPTGALCLQPHMKKLPYGVDSFQFIGMATQQPVVLMTGKNAPWKNIEGMVAMVRKNPGKYTALGGKIPKGALLGPSALPCRHARCPGPVRGLWPCAVLGQEGGQSEHAQLR